MENLDNTFDPDQLIVIAAWLEAKEEAGYTLSELIDEFTERNRGDSLTDETLSLQDLS